MEKMQVNGPEGYKLARKKSLTVSVACVAIYRPTPGFKGRPFKLSILTRWDFNFCVRRSLLRGRKEEEWKEGRKEDKLVTGFYRPMNRIGQSPQEEEEVN